MTPMTGVNTMSLNNNLGFNLFLPQSGGIPSNYITAGKHNLNDPTFNQNPVTQWALDFNINPNRGANQLCNQRCKPSIDAKALPTPAILNPEDKESGKESEQASSEESSNERDQKIIS